VDADGRPEHESGDDRRPADGTTPDVGAPPLVELCGISRRHGRALVLDRVDLELAPGELHVLVGGRGAGKSTLLRLLAGLERPDSGQILVRGESRRIDSPRAALRLGIGALLERPAVSETLTVAESVVLGAEPGRVLFGRRGAAERVAALGGQLGLTLDPHIRVSALTRYERRQVELLALVHRGTSVFLVDDWFVGLNEDRAEKLLAALAKLRTSGCSALVAARPDGPLLELADRVTGLEDGHPASDSTPGRSRSSPVRGEPLLQVKGLWVADQGEEQVVGADLGARQGEIYGLTGAAGEGQAALIAAVVGLCRAETGRIYLGDEDVTGAGVAARRQLGLAYLPSPGEPGGLIGRLTLWENAALGQQGRPWCSRHGLVDRRALRTAAAEQAAAVAVRVPGPGLRAWQLAPGERQRLVLARGLARRPTLLVAARPTHGLDRTSTALLWRRLREEARAGLTVLLWSTDPEEVVALADRVGVMAGGRIVAELGTANLSASDLARALANPNALEERGLPAPSHSGQASGLPR
jgi:general nucleoside transport system ATP-binding protein